MSISRSTFLMLCIASLISLELVTVAQAKVVKYTLEAYYFSGSRDGVYKDKILGINGQFPGPLIEANIGDMIEITFINSIQDGQNATLHWHGLHQRGYLFEDGTSMISQCPLPQGRSMMYHFNATIAGTFWYHSHVNSQYTEGMFGPLVIHDTPEPYAYDGEFTLMLSDWYHQTAQENEDWHLSPGSYGVPPYPHSGLINGLGRFPCEYAERLNRSCDAKKQQRPVIRVQQDKVYRVRVINAAAVAAFNFSIDLHPLDTFEADGIYASKAVTADIVPIASGQRYSFLIKCRPHSDGRNESRYLIRSTLRRESLMLIHEEERKNINIYPESLDGNITAILECVDQDLSHHKNFMEYRTEMFTFNNEVPPVENLEDLKVLDEMELTPLDGILAPDYFDSNFVVEVGFYEDKEDIRRGSFNETPFMLPSDKPLLMKLIDGETIPESAVPLEINYGSVVQLVINNDFFGPHPFHLHGHHFWIVGLGEWDAGSYDPEKHNLTIHGVKRDTVLVHEKSWAVIRFVADNPGVWLFHCHIDWHVLSGMALTFVEGADILRNNTKVPDEALQVCRMHDEPATTTLPSSHFHEMWH